MLTKESAKITTISLPPPLFKQATRKADKLHGRRGLSRYVRQLINADLAHKT